MAGNLDDSLNINFQAYLEANTDDVLQAVKLTDKSRVIGKDKVVVQDRRVKVPKK
jgi:hypothetical protein